MLDVGKNGLDISSSFLSVGDSLLGVFLFIVKEIFSLKQVWLFSTLPLIELVVLYISFDLTIG